MPRNAAQRIASRRLVEATRRLDLAAIWRAGLFVRGQRTTGSLPGGLAAMVDLTGIALPRLTVTDHQVGYARTQALGLAMTRSLVSVTRWWFLCPKTGRRARVLYRPVGEDLFASRGAWGLAYRSQRGTDAARTAARASAALARLGVPCWSGSGPVPQRPTGMHLRTYSRLTAIIEAAR